MVEECRQEEGRAYDKEGAKGEWQGKEENSKRGKKINEARVGCKKGPLHKLTP
jgi:hypothetical protein